MKYEYSFRQTTTLTFEELKTELMRTGASDPENSCHPYVSNAKKIDEDTIQYTDQLTMLGIPYEKKYNADFIIDDQKHTIKVSVNAGLGVKVEHNYSFYIENNIQYLKDEVYLQARWPFRKYVYNTAYPAHRVFVSCIAAKDPT